jgi:hypothetical protein
MQAKPSEASLGCEILALADAEHVQLVAERNYRYAEREPELVEDLFGAPGGSASPAFTNAIIQAGGVRPQNG